MYSTFVRQFLKDDATILDAGAHFGEDTFKLSELWPAGKIIAFEPNPLCYPTIQEKLPSHPNVIFYPAGLGAKTGTAQLFLSRGDTSGADTILTPDLEDDLWQYMLPKDFSQTIEVPIWNLDDWTKENGIAGIDFLHLDMEGAEGLMLQASPNILKTTSFIQIEYRHSKPFHGAMNYPEIVTLLHSHGFNLLRCQEHKAAYFNIIGDALFIRSDI